MEKRLIIITHIFSIAYLLFICFPISLLLSQFFENIGSGLMTGSLASLGYVLYYLGSIIDPMSFYEDGLFIGLVIAFLLSGLEFFVFKITKSKRALALAIILIISVPVLLALHGLTTAVYK